MEQEKHIKPKKICLNNLNKDNIVDFLHWLEIAKGNSVKTRNARSTSDYVITNHFLFSSETPLITNNSYLEATYNWLVPAFPFLFALNCFTILVPEPPSYCSVAPDISPQTATILEDQ